MTNLATRFYQFEQPYDPFNPTPDALPIRSPLLSEAVANAVPVVKNWSHPFKDKRNPLQQLTHLAKATAGHYPLGVGGLWHGGVHFDGGTAGTLDQSSVHCLADGEVVAYRIDHQSPTTAYWVNKISVQTPFSRNFVLVRHRLQLPKVESSTVEPPSLIFYSLYMHLQDWAVYEGDEAIVRPPFWAEGATRYVKDDVNDVHFHSPGQKGLNVRIHAQQGPVLTLLPRGAQVTVSGEGDYRKLENTVGPDFLKDADGSLPGYLSIDYLRPIAGGQYRVTCKDPKDSLMLRAEANARGNVIAKLLSGTEVTISGEGTFRKLERINQYVHYKSLQDKQEPVAQGQVVVLDKPVPIKAGDLIGHIGLYQDWGAEQPEKKLHLEVFSGDDVQVFIKNSRAWAQRLPASSKTWLKFAKGTAVVTHQDYFGSQRPPSLSTPYTLSDADLLIPKSVLDGLHADRKISVAAAWEQKACIWYRLDGLLHGPDNTLLDGWVREEVGVTPWFSPWEWEGYDALFNFTAPRNMLASFLRATNKFDDEQLQRFGPFADAGDKGAIKERLYELIDRNRDGKINGQELQTALSLPAHAQSISQLMVKCESEWRHTPQKWDALDELLGHSGSTPHLNWLAEKERIKQLSWWGEVAEKVGLPGHGSVFHFHPVGLVANFARTAVLIDVESFLTQYEKEHVLFSAGTRTLTTRSKENLRKIVTSINNYYEGSTHETNLYEVSYMLATARHEAYHFPTGEFFSEEPEVGEPSYFYKYDPVLAPTPELRATAIKNGNTKEGHGYKYRGRGCVHLTWKDNYKKFSDILLFDFVSNPDAAAKFEHSIPIMIIGMSKGLFTGKKFRDYINSSKVDYLSARRIINGVDERERIASYAIRFEKLLKSTSQLPSEF